MFGFDYKVQLFKPRSEKFDLDDCLFDEHMLNLAYDTSCQLERACKLSTKYLYDAYFCRNQFISALTMIFAAGQVRRVVKSLLSNPKSATSQVHSHLTAIPSGTPFGLYQRNLYCTISIRSFNLHKLFHRKVTVWKNLGLRKYNLSSPAKILLHQTRFAEGEISWLCFSRASSLLKISQVARAVSFAFTRSHPLTPGILLFIIGELVWGERRLAEAEYFQNKDTLYMYATYGHVSSFLFLLIEALILIFRAVYLSIIFWPCILMAPLAESLGDEFRRVWLRVVRTTLEKGGPAFIKWGQWAATRPDLFANDLCIELAELHTKAPAHSYAYTKKTVEDAFGRQLHEIFDKFEEEPVASGSIAQIHRATLKFRYPKRRVKPTLVAVKVRHPGVGEAIRRDFILINLFAKISSIIPTLRWLRLDESIQQFAVFMMTQVDLAREAANLSRFNYNFRRWKDVSFPKPLYPLVHPAVLVETYEHGESVLQFIDKLEGHQHIKSALAHIGTHSLLKMLLADNFVHADMHPGNILVRVSEEIVSTEALRDGQAVAKCTLQLSKQQNCPNPRAFIEEVDRTFKFWDSTEGELIHAADCMHQLLEQVRHHRVNIDGNVCTVMVTMLVLEGWQRKLDPEYDVMSTLQTLLFKADWAESLIYTIEGLMAP
ncbi:hypothetical protein Leryth_005949 [Lithospermum erythrorhizon]|nr:hypothetical protein Leryth_005949 [Lithospermum erythrorhizon]